MEYKELYSKKKRKTYVFCDFEELLKEGFGVSNMSEVEDKAKGSEYILGCPFCRKEGHTKDKLYIKTDLTVGHCFVCTRDYINLTSEVRMEVPDYEGLPQIHPGCQVVPLTDSEWNLDMYNYDFDDTDENGIRYLIGRHKFLGELYKILGFKFLDGNIVMPFKYKGEVFYYQIRFTNTNNDRFRYFFPPITAKPPYIIEKDVNKKFIICEGVYDAVACLIMAPEYTPMAVLGKTISDYQLSFLREYVPEEIVVYMDKTEISVDLIKRLSTVIDYCPIHLIKSSGEDPEECLVRRMRWNKDLQWITPELFRKDAHLKIGEPKFKNFRR